MFFRGAPYHTAVKCSIQVKPFSTAQQQQQHLAHLFRHDEGDFHVAEVGLELRADRAGHGDLGLLGLFGSNRCGHRHRRRLRLVIIALSPGVIPENIPASNKIRIIHVHDIDPPPLPLPARFVADTCI